MPGEANDFAARRAVLHQDVNQWATDPGAKHDDIGRPRLLAAIAKVQDLGNQEIAHAHSELARRTEELTTATTRLLDATEHLNTATNRLSRLTLCLNVATAVLIAATVFLALVHLGVLPGHGG